MAYTHIDSLHLSGNLSGGSIVITGLIASGAVSSAKIAADAVDSVHLASGAIDSEHINADAVDSVHLASGAIDSEHINALQVKTAHMTSGAIDSTQIASGAIDTNHIDALQITTALLAADCVDGTKIADDAIDSEHYVDGSIDTVHISANIALFNAYTANVAISALEVGYLNASGYIDKAKADSSGTMPAVAIATANVTSGSIDNFQVLGSFTDAAINFSGYIGKTLYVSPSVAGELTSDVSVFTSGQLIQTFGYVEEDSKIMVNPSFTMQQVGGAGGGLA